MPFKQSAKYCYTDVVRNFSYFKTTECLHYCPYKANYFSSTQQGLKVYSGTLYKYLASETFFYSTKYALANLASWFCCSPSYLYIFPSSFCLFAAKSPMANAPLSYRCQDSFIFLRYAFLHILFPISLNIYSYLYFYKCFNENALFL